MQEQLNAMMAERKGVKGRNHNELSPNKGMQSDALLLARSQQRAADAGR